MNFSPCAPRRRRNRRASRTPPSATGGPSTTPASTLSAHGTSTTATSGPVRPRSPSQPSRRRTVTDPLRAAEPAYSLGFTFRTPLPPEEKWRLREAEEYAKEKAARRERRAAAASGAPPVCSNESPNTLHRCPSQPQFAKAHFWQRIHPFLRRRRCSLRSRSRTSHSSFRARAPRRADASLPLPHASYCYVALLPAALATNERRYCFCVLHLRRRWVCSRPPRTFRR